MTTDPERNLAHSVHDRLLNRARARQEDLNLLFTRYALERLLFRLSRSPHRERFVLKGAMLLQLWAEEPYRPTRDLDLLGYGAPDPAQMAQVFREVCTIEVDADGLHFDGDSIRCSVLKPDEEYEGVRVQLTAWLGTAPIRLHIDIGFGDAVTPEPKELEYPSLLGQPAAHLRTYPPETVIAEKLEALVRLGLANSRMKDFYDLWILSRTADFDGSVLVQALTATFRRRRTSIPTSMPVGLTPAFAKQAQWQAFVRRGRLRTEPPGLAAVLADLRSFLGPALQAAAQDLALSQHWQAGGPWTPAGGT